MKERGPAPATIMNLVSGFGFTECAIKLRDSSSGVIPMKDEWSGWFRFSWGILGSFSNGLSSLRHSFLLKSKEFSSKSSPKYSSG
jgi:hypothetical protein